MSKTVTLRKARPGRKYVQIADTRFYPGEPVRDVDDTTLEALKAIPGVEVHVAAGAHKPADDPPTPPTAPTAPEAPTALPTTPEAGGTP